MAGTVTYPVPVQHRSRGVVRTHITVTTDAAGDASLTAVGVGFGRLVGFLYDGGLDASASITLKDDKTGAIVFGPYVTGTEGTPVAFRPTAVVTDNAGVAITAATTASKVNRPIFVAGRLDIVVASGGNVEHGVIGLIVDEAGIGDLALTV
jgi:hypothetical protein